MKKNFTRFFALMAGVVLPSMAMAELAYNVPFTEADWNDETTIVADEGDNAWSSKHGICLGDNILGGFDYSDKCYMCHSACIEDAKAVAALVEERFPKLNGKVLINNIGTTIGSHTGPGTVALFFWGDEREA